MSKTQPKMAIRSKSEALSTKYTVMFESDIEDAEEHSEQFYVMEQAGKDDIVEVSISSIGGSVATISKFQDVIKNSEAHFHGKLHGYGYSAGGALFLLCDSWEVSDLATFMAHSVQTGYGGGTQAIEAHSKMSAKQNRTLCEMLYKDFLSPEEIDKICDGFEIWMDAEEIRERLEKRQTLREAALIEESKETYTPEFYAQSILADISEDCAQFDYDIFEILDIVKNTLLGVESEEHTPVGEDANTLVEDVETVAFFSSSNGVYELSVFSNGLLYTHDDEPFFQTFEDIKEELDVDDLKGYAELLEVKHSWNIGKTTLAERLDKKVKEILDESETSC